MPRLTGWRRTEPGAHGPGAACGRHAMARCFSLHLLAQRCQRTQRPLLASRVRVTRRVRALHTTGHHHPGTQPAADRCFLKAPSRARAEVHETWRGCRFPKSRWPPAGPQRWRVTQARQLWLEGLGVVRVSNPQQGAGGVQNRHRPKIAGYQPAQWERWPRAAPMKCLRPSPSSWVLLWLLC